MWANLTVFNSREVVINKTTKPKPTKYHYVISIVSENSYLQSPWAWHTLTIHALCLTDFSLKYTNISYTLKRQGDRNRSSAKSCDIIELAAIWHAGWSQFVLAVDWVLLLVASSGFRSFSTPGAPILYLK